jgi:hypothetical protein
LSILFAGACICKQWLYICITITANNYLKI